MKEYRFLSPVGIFLAFVIAGCGGSGGDAQPPPPADTTPPVTTASPAGGLYNTQQQVTLTANEAATIYYSTDGNDPGVGAGNTTSGVSPVAAIPIPSGTTELRFYAIDQASNSEAVKTEIYEVDDIAPNVSITSGAPSPTGLLGESIMTWQSDEDGSYAIEIGGNGTQGSGTQIAAGAVQAGTPVDQTILGRQMSYLGPTEIWVYVSDALSNTGADNELFSLKPFVTIPGVAPTGSFSRLVVNHAGTRLYARDNGIQVVDIDSTSGTYNTVIASVTVGNSTRLMAITPDDSRLYVADEQSSSIYVVDTATNTVSTILSPVGLNLPEALAITPDGTRLYVTHWGATLNVLDIDPGSGSYHSILDNIFIDGLFLWGEIAITPDGALAVVNWRGMIASAVDVVDVDPGSPSYNIPIARPVPITNGDGTEVTVSSDSMFAYADVGTYSNSLKKIDLSDYSVPVQVGNNVTGITLTTDDKSLLAGSSLTEEIYIFSADDLSVLESVPIDGGFYASVMTPDGNYAYAGNSVHGLIMLPLQ